MTGQPVVELKNLPHPEQTLEWLKKLFYDLRLLKKNKIQLEFIKANSVTGERAYIRIIRKG